MTEPKTIAVSAEAATVPILKNNTYTSLTDMLWGAHPIKTEPIKPGRVFIRFTITPPVIKEGFVTIEGRTFYVTFDDLLRRRINVTREFIQRDTKSTSSTDTEESAPVAEQTSNTDKSRAIKPIGIPDNEDIDLYWRDQIRTLQRVENPEEEWLD